MGIWSSVKNLFGIKVSTTVTFPYFDLLVAAILFAVIMYIGNLFFKGDRNKLLSLALLAIAVLFVFFFL